MTTTLEPQTQDVEHDDDRDVPAVGTELELSTAEVVDAEIIDDDEDEGLAPLAAVTAPPSMRMERLDPRLLMDNPRNSPKRLRDLTDLISSMPIVGVLEPLVVVPLDPPVTVTDEDTKTTITYEYMLLMGHRRKYAAITVELPHVPCWVVDDHGAVYQILAQLLENSHRAGLSPTEEAESFHQLTLEGWNEQQIAQVRAIPATQVRKTLRIRELPEAAKQALDAEALSFDEAAALAEFEDAPRVYEKLVAEIGNKWRFQQALTSARASRIYTAAKDLARANLVIDGVKVTSRPKKFGYDSTEVDVRQLTDADGQPLDPQQVKTMPGMAAFIERDGTTAKTVVYCVDPDKYGYRRAQSPRYSWMSPEQAAEKEAQEQAQAETREQLRQAAEVRREFIRATWGTAKAARSLYVAALRADLIGQDLKYSDDLTDLYTALGGADLDALLTAGEDKLRRSLVARWLCALESNLELAVGEYPWNFDDHRGLAFYNLLITVDEPYPLTDAEMAHYDLLTAKLTSADPDEDAEDDEAENDEAENDEAQDHGIEHREAGDLDGDADTGADHTLNASLDEQPEGRQPDGDEHDDENVSEDAGEGEVSVEPAFA
ncbi:ParB/RepB/Spo0J family partition protein [Paractinoplanes toevensis]|uniref:ParB-like N-terminal domain-containing protein n=1 Tax=Paractinoplanes toevensis TaxID=571911 RepID=A0A919WDB4_9ACTN|nr:ParB N-terminal domain-containing protein [Actinoplanes toevensis]GIM98042.1 hypothetical protein Ato02nite_098350 [Actinoplanes toevensis]